MPGKRNVGLRRSRKGGGFAVGHVKDRIILGLDAHKRLDQFRADVLGDLAHVAPMRPLGDADDVVLRSGEFGVSARLFEIPLELLVVNVADALEEQKREDEFLVTGRVDLSAQENRRAPEVLLKFGG